MWNRHDCGCAGAELDRGVIDRERQDANNQAAGGYERSFWLSGFGGSSVDFRLADNPQARLVEVAALVGVRIEKETLGATFHLVLAAGVFGVAAVRIS